MPTIIDAEREGRHDEAVLLYRELLEARLSVYKPNSAPVAGSYSCIASACISAGKLDEAEEAMQKTCAIYEETNDRDELALAYATVAELREAQDRMLDARELRLKGEDSGEMVCSYTRVGKILYPLAGKLGLFRDVSLWGHSSVRFSKLNTDFSMGLPECSAGAS